MKLTAQAVEGFAKTLLVKDFDDAAETPEFHRQIWEICCSDDKLVAVAAPRGHAKSTAVSFIYVLAAVLFRQAINVVLVANTEEQAKNFLDGIRKALTLNDDLISLFGVQELETDTKTELVARMEDGHRFRIIAKGSGQQVRGMLWEAKTRPDLIVGDDLENDEMVMNDERRATFRQWIIGALLPSLSPRGKVRIVGTILHLDSFLARIVPLEGDRDSQEDFGGLRFSFKPPKPGDLKAGRMFKGYLYKAHIGDHPSEIKNDTHMLWPARFKKEDYENLYLANKDIGHPELYAQEYLNRPLDPSLAFFRKSDLIPWSKEDHDAISEGRRPLLFYAGGDLAITEKERADWTAFVVVGIDSNGIMYVMDVIRDRMDGRKIVNEIIALQKKWKLQWFALEQDKTAKSILPFLKEEMIKPHNDIVNIVPIIPHTDKTARAYSMQGRMRIGAVKFKKNAEWYPILEGELLTFPRGKYDDQVDALSCIGLALQKLSQAATLEEEIEQEIREQEEITLSGNDGRSSITGY